jgi:peptidoglycan hydrolase-like protein with peptidoglycan-binding domain
LDDFTANAGKKNYTRFNRDLISYKQGIGAQPMEWCGAFTSCMFVYAFGLEEAKRLLCGGLHCYTPSGANYFKKAGRYIKRGEGMPKAGDVVFFFSKTKGRIGHVGIVTKVTSTMVHTIEGNTSGANTLVTNGGGVRQKAYSLNSTYIDGYGRPPYNGENEKPEIKKGCEGQTVKEAQELLLVWKPDCLPKWGADGEFGTETLKAVKDFQKGSELKVDGVVGEETWKALNALQGLKKVVVTGASVNIRNGAGTEHLIVAIAHKGDEFDYVSTAENGWYRIKSRDVENYISNKFSKIEIKTEEHEKTGE